MKWYDAAGIGWVMGCLYGLVLWASVDAFSLLSFLKYGDRFYMPFRITAVIIVDAFLCLFSVPVWYPFAERGVQDFGEWIAEELRRRMKNEP
jgi:hypothetical protein